MLGAGLDYATGILYDHSGNDHYLAENDAQGAGIKPFGMGLLIDAAGIDRYEAARNSPGFTADPAGREGFPIDKWHVGIPLDLKSADSYLQANVPRPRRAGRIQNRQGIAVGN